MFSMTSLKCFYVAANELNFTRAAKQLYISQQALSNHIAKLESYFDVRLFDRGSPLTLTDAGRSLQIHAREILNNVDNYTREVQDIKDFRQGELTIGIPVTRGTIMLPPLLASFHNLFPQIKLNLVEGTSTGNITDALYEGTADLCIGYQPDDLTGLAVSKLYEEKFILVVPKRLMQKYYPNKVFESDIRTPHSLRVFSKLPFVAQNPDTMNGKTFLELCRLENISPNVVVHTQNLITELSLCLEELGACVLPSTFLTPLNRDYGHPPLYLFSEKQFSHLSFFLLEGLPQSFQISVCRLKSKTLTRAGKEFIHLAQEIYRGYGL